MNTRTNAAFAAVDAAICTNPKDRWSDPEDIVRDLPVAPAFDAEVLLPRQLAEFVLDEADRMCAAPDFIAAALIVAMGAVIGTKCAIKPKRRDDWVVTPNLYGGVVGDPSVKKSPTIGTVMRFLDHLESREVELLQDKLKIYKAEMAAYEAHESAIKTSMKRAVAGTPDRARMLAAQADLEELEQPEEPQPRRFKSNDATVEKLGEILCRNPTGLLVFRDELMGLLASWEREGREGDKAFYLEGWNGTSSFAIDRIGRGSQFIKSLCLSVFGGIQPDLLERYLGGIVNSMDNDGRIQRFQVLVYPEQPIWKWCDRYPVTGAREAVRGLFSRLAEFDPLQDGATPADDFVKLPHFCFDDEAQQVFIEWCTELNCERIPNEGNPMMRQHLGKFEKLFCSIALILHLAEGNLGSVGLSCAIRSVAWCEYLEGHARRIYGLVETTKITTAKMLACRLAEGKLANGFVARDVVRKGWAGIKTTADAEAALQILEEHGWVISRDGIPESGRPTTRYVINPKARAAK